MLACFFKPAKGGLHTPAGSHISCGSSAGVSAKPCLGLGFSLSLWSPSLKEVCLLVSGLAGRAMWEQWVRDCLPLSSSAPTPRSHWALLPTESNSQSLPGQGLRKGTGDHNQHCRILSSSHCYGEGWSSFSTISFCLTQILLYSVFFLLN